MRIGVHLGLGQGYEEALSYAKDLGCTTVQIFTHSPRTFAFKALEPKKQLVLRDGWKRLGIAPVVSHASYLINIGAVEPRKFHGALSILRKELEYAAAFGCSYVVYHVGKHTDNGLDAGMAQIVKGLDALRVTLEETGVTLLLETAAGQGTEIGRSFDEIADILVKVSPGTRKHLGVCVDTCHIFAAGYDIADADAVVRAIEKSFGMERVKVVHVNDSKFGRGEKRDRHEHIGKGRIGKAGLRAFLTHPKIRGLPMILETPVDDDRDQYGDMAALREVLS